MQPSSYNAQQSSDTYTDRVGQERGCDLNVGRINVKGNVGMTDNKLQFSAGDFGVYCVACYQTHFLILFLACCN